MKAFCTATLCFSLLTIAACDEEYIEAPRLFPIQNSADASRLHAQLCQSHERALFLAEESVIRWRALKNGAPVEGTQKVAGHLVSDSATRMQGLAIHLDFDVASVDSADELRDTRIMNYVLGLAEGFPMNFDLTSTSGEGQEFPVGDNGAAMDVAGTLSVTNKKAAVTAKINVAKVGNGYGLSTGPTPLSLNLKTDLGLVVEVERLMSLVEDVTLDDTITISFDLLFEDGCT